MTAPVFTPLARIAVPKGDVYRGLRCDEPSFAGFGEAYFTSIQPGAVKGWRRHRSMVLNLVVPVGQVRFVIVGAEAVGSEGRTGEASAFDLGEAPDLYGRLTVPPGAWLAFQGLAAGASLILNIASIPHDPEESETRELNAFTWDWASAGEAERRA